MKLTNAMNFISILILMLLSSSFTGQEKKGIEFFNGTLKEALAKAKAEKKAVFFDAYAVWCGPCKNMELNVFTDLELGKYFNEHFVSIRIDMEKGEGPDLAKKFTSIDGYPSMLFLDNEGHVIKTLLGSRYTEDLLAEGKLVR